MAVEGATRVAAASSGAAERGISSLGLTAVFFLLTGGGFLYIESFVSTVYPLTFIVFFGIVLPLMWNLPLALVTGDMCEFLLFAASPAYASARTSRRASSNQQPTAPATDSSAGATLVPADATIDVPAPVDTQRRLRYVPGVHTGIITWIYMGMGPRVSWHIGVASWLAQLLDAVVLVSALWVYIVKGIGTAGWHYNVPLTVGFMMAAMAAATMIAGAASLGRSSAVTYARAACFMLPFVVIPSAMCSIAGWDFMVFAPSPYFAPGPNLSDFYLLLMWRASDWLQASYHSRRVRRPELSVPVSLFVSSIGGILCDLFPMIIAICIDAEWDIWAPFSFPDIATKFAIRSCPGLRVLMYLSAAVSVTWKLVGRLTTGHLISSALDSLHNGTTTSGVLGRHPSLLIGFVAVTLVALTIVLEKTVLDVLSVALMVHCVEVVLLGVSFVSVKVHLPQKYSGDPQMDLNPFTIMMLAILPMLMALIAIAILVYEPFPVACTLGLLLVVPILLRPFATASRSRAVDTPSSSAS